MSKIITNDSFITDKVKKLDSLDENMVIIDKNVSEVKSIIDEKVA